MLLVDAMNTFNPALAVLKEKGYSLGIGPSTVKEGEEPDTYYSVGFWFARKGDRVFQGESPVALLGLVAMWEARGEDWRTRPGENYVSRIMEGEFGDEF